MSHHVKTPEHQIHKKMHISHLYNYISAYQYSPEAVDELITTIRDAQVKAKSTLETQFVNHDGEMFFAVHASGYFALCIPWKTFEFCED